MLAGVGAGEGSAVANRLMAAEAAKPLASAAAHREGLTWLVLVASRTVTAVTGRWDRCSRDQRYDGPGEAAHEKRNQDSPCLPVVAHELLNTKFQN